MQERYFIRLDDACPTWSRDRWLRVLDLLVEAGVKPLIAVVPDNQDPDLGCQPSDPGFWDRLKHWQDAGWPLGLHGFQHRLQRRPLGLIPRNAFGEWAGSEVQDQRARMRQAWGLVQQQGWTPTWWVAPAHNMDRGTLLALESETPIRRISDGWARRPFRRWGFLWLPQQLGRPRRMGRGFWTICLHPNMMGQDELVCLRSWLKTKPAMGSWNEVEIAARDYGLEEGIMHGLWALRYRLTSLKAAL